MNQFKKLAGQTAIYGLGSVIPRILNYILLTPFYTRVLTSISDYGTHTYLYSYSAFLIILLTFGMETTFFRYAKSRGIEKVFTTSFYFLFINGLLFSILIFLFGGKISNAIGILKVEYLWYFVGIIALDVFSAIPFAALRYIEKARLFAILKIFNVSVNIVINLIYLWLIPLLINNFGWDFSSVYSSENLLEYTFRANLIANILTFVILIPRTKQFFTKIDFVIFKEMLIYSAPIMISGILGMINEVADKILLKYLLPKNVTAFEQIGIYAANYKIAALITIFNSMFRYALEPFFFKIYGNEDSKLKYAIISKYYLIFGMFILLAVSLFIDIFKYFISENYHSGLHIVPIVLLANLFFGMYYTMAVWYKVTDKTYFSAIFALVGALVTIAGNYVLIPVMGYTGSAIATLMCYFVMFLCTVYFGQRNYRISYDYSFMIQLTFFSTLLFLLYSFVDIENLYLKLLFSAILMGGYVIFVVFTNKEIKDKILSYGQR
jgi:O-antigen/teichoic acid export membrane protein